MLFLRVIAIFAIHMPLFCESFSKHIEIVPQELVLPKNYLKEKNCESNSSSTNHYCNQIQKQVLNFNQHHDEYNLLDIWNLFPTAIMKNVSSLSSSCRKAYNSYLDKLSYNDFDSLKMYDATGKLSSGILRGNINQYGDFDECLEVDNGQYCLAEIDLEPLWSKSFSNVKNLVHSHYAIKETFNDPGHRVPGFTMIRWGFCIPEDCSNIDLQNALWENLGVKSRIRSTMCQSERSFEKPSTFGDKLAKIIFGLLITLTLIAAWMHYMDYSNKWLDCFCLQKNINKLITLDDDKNQIRAIDGVRSLCALGLLMAHKSMALLYNPYMNRTAMAENLGMEWSVIGRTAILFTDGFILLSGLLNARSLFSDLDKQGSMKVKDKLVSRLFRIVPNLLAVILFCTYILPQMGSGPLWPIVINHHSELCKKFMWRNLLFIHNYFGFENMCLTHTHQIGIDMQLFLFTPLLVIILRKNKTYGFAIMGLLAVISTILRFWISWQRNLSPLVYFGIPISRMFDTANYSYILPTHRATIYILGVFLAYVLKYKPFGTEFLKLQSTKLWAIFLGMGLTIWLGPAHIIKRGYIYNSFEAALYAAWSPIFWGFALSWVIIAVNNNIGGLLGRLLEKNMFKRFTKISYAVYLVQFPVFFYNVGITRHIGEFSPLFLFPILEFSAVLILSSVLTVIVEIPFQNIRRQIQESSNFKTDRRVNISN